MPGNKHRKLMKTKDEESSSSSNEEDYNDIVYSSDNDEDGHSNEVLNDKEEKEEDEEEDEIDYSKLTSIDDLPSDDSISLSSSDSNDSDSEEEIKVNNMSIGEKLAYMSRKPLKKTKANTKPQQLKEETKKKKKSKHKPAEVSSSHKQYRKERKQNLLGGNNGISDDVMQSSNQYKPRDPRMNSLCGHYDVNVFEKRYSFLEEMEEDEMQKLKNRIRAKKLSKKKGIDVALEEYGIDQNDLSGTLEEDQKEYANLTNRRSHRQKERTKRNTTQKLKKSIQENVTLGNQTPYYLKKKDIKQKLLEQKFDNLTNNGDRKRGKNNVDKIMEKKRRKLHSK